MSAADDSTTKSKKTGKKGVIIKEIQTYPCTYLNSPYTQECEKTIKLVTQNPLVRRRLRHNFFPIQLEPKIGPVVPDVNTYDEAMKLADKAPEKNMAKLARNIMDNFKMENGEIVPAYHDDEAIDCIENYIKFAAADMFNM